ncbi:divalent-cation tolerance protein CutA [Phormidium tenue]|uniref:Divalent-cation tolerance protein CutA n=1 Tax=Phormidium tenue NIES-30 TaxID=549789 RepID=A0A1U7J4E6_9CYAN|nr:divalent-cation tolerance protein CutA [Phormidium tenue]MBD2232922.1 divalent-cation tolerance protein CutA [Phormidium tenue FACHB-1052]OKH47400.1 divalent-cation tolerance protein CutA [Phormidium tenue NIES-30]
MSPPSLGVVLVTAGSEAEAESLARYLIEARLAACVSVLPIRSVYRWQGNIHAEPEWQLIIKADLSQFDAIAQIITQHHSYEVPEIIALPIVAGLPDYLSWLQAQVQSS